ncbi:MAG: hypothetical protein WD336_02490 [Trueperaceae bacterium]
MSDRIEFRAGCDRRTWAPADLSELAYTALEHPECPGCPHRISPPDGPDFCRWLPRDRPHPFAPLRDLAVDGEDAP